MERNHKEEMDVQIILALTPKDKERRRLLEELKRKGDYKLNIDCLKDESSETAIVVENQKAKRLLFHAHTALVFSPKKASTEM